MPSVPNNRVVYCEAADKKGAIPTSKASLAQFSFSLLTQNVGLPVTADEEAGRLFFAYFLCPHCPFSAAWNKRHLEASIYFLCCTSLSPIVLEHLKNNTKKGPAVNLY